MDELVLRLQWKARDNRYKGWAVYRWVGVCGFLSIASLMLLALIQ